MNCARIQVSFTFLIFISAALIGTLQGQLLPSPSPSPFPTWQDEISKGYLPYHQLTVDDFPIDDKAHPEIPYFAQPFLHPFYHYEMGLGSGGFVYAYITDWIVFSGFDKNLSSRKSKFREMKAFLPYVQTLLDILELHARQFAALKPSDLPIGQAETFEKAHDQLDDRFRALDQTKASEAAKEAAAFSKATDNGRNQKKVRELAAEIKKRLAATPSINPPSQPSPTPAAR